MQKSFIPNTARGPRSPRAVFSDRKSKIFPRKFPMKKFFDANLYLKVISLQGRISTMTENQSTRYHFKVSAMNLPPHSSTEVINGGKFPTSFKFYIARETGETMQL
jgi:hypothetical protein